MSTAASSQPRGMKSVAVIGAGNIGSHLLPLIARMPAVGRVTIVDFDSYEEGNLASQDITRADIGLPKAIRQMVRLRAIHPRLAVVPVVARVEAVPLGALRADVIAACLDSRAARRTVNRIACRLGVPFVDSGVHADGMLARVNVYRPGGENVCLECLWEESDYQAERESYACDGSRIAAAPSHSPSSLGALAAALQAIEVEKILAGDWERAACGSEVLIDANSHRHFVTKLPRNRACRFDHRTFSARALAGPPSALTLADVFGRGAASIHFEGQPFARQWACGSCRTSAEFFGLRDRIAGGAVCPQCGGAMRAIGFHSLERLSPQDVPAAAITAPLSNLGFRTGDVFGAVVDGTEAHFEITEPNSHAHD